MTKFFRKFRIEARVREWSGISETDCRFTLILSDPSKETEDYSNAAIVLTVDGARLLIEELHKAADASDVIL